MENAVTVDIPSPWQLCFHPGKKNLHFYKMTPAIGKRNGKNYQKDWAVFHTCIPSHTPTYISLCCMDVKWIIGFMWQRKNDIYIYNTNIFHLMYMLTISQCCCEFRGTIRTRISHCMRWAGPKWAFKEIELHVEAIIALFTKYKSEL